MRMVFAVVLASCLLGCASGPVASVKRDPFDGTVRTEVAENYLGGSEFATAHVELNPVSVRNEKGLQLYALHLRYYGPFWIFIPEGEGLVLLVDGQRMPLTGPGSAAGRRSVESGTTVFEAAVYPVTLDQIKQIASASSVRVKIYGQRYQFERIFLPRNFKAFQDFAAALRS